MTIRTILAATLIGAAALTASAAAEAGSLGRADVTKLFPGQFEAQVKGYRVSFSGSRGGALAGGGPRRRRRRHGADGLGREPRRRALCL